MEMWAPLIGEYGFPIMITLYLLNRIETKLDTLNDSINSLASEKHYSFSQKASS